MSHFQKDKEILLWRLVLHKIQQTKLFTWDFPKPLKIVNIPPGGGDCPCHPKWFTMVNGIISADSNFEFVFWVCWGALLSQPQGERYLPSPDALFSLLEALFQLPHLYIYLLFILYMDEITFISDLISITILIFSDYYFHSLKYYFIAE